MSKETLLNSTDVQSNEIPKTVLGLEEKYQEENNYTIYQTEWL